MLPQKQFDTNAQCPLDGVRIVDLSRVVAGNMVSLALADFGAEVIKATGVVSTGRKMKGVAAQ